MIGKEDFCRPLGENYLKSWNPIILEKYVVGYENSTTESLELSVFVYF
jgi:hypothetical protein